MSELFHQLSENLRHDEPSNIVALEKLFNSLSLENQARNRPIVRLARIFNQFHSYSTYPADFLVLLRQVIRYWDVMPLHINIFNNISDRLYDFSLVKYDTVNRNEVKIDALEWKNDRLDGSENIESLVPRRNFAPVTGNGTLYEMTRSSDKRFLTYQYAGQQYAVEASLYAANGSTTLIIIPTGGGKSLATVFPAWIESRGGHTIGGTTIVVVPTVSLAHDQISSARRFFHGSGTPPQVWTSDTSATQRTDIISSLMVGTLPLLYVSPEALLSPRLHEACLMAAKAGHLKRIVIDEAHIVETWGAGFRPEFQYLGAFCRQINQYNGNQLRLLLLSATISESTRDTLETVFSLGDTSPFQIITANQLRPEISYYALEDKTLHWHETHVLEALNHLPRPLILYVTKREDAEKWYKKIHEVGYQRLAVYTGDTKSDQRAMILNEWNKDQTDIMIATSAFGMGVDKPDIRTVLHACIPENIDRYYQEVGRGGRDGYSSISLVCYFTPEHQATALGMNTKAVVTVDKGLARWHAMWEKRDRVGDVWIINTDERPNYIEDDFNKTKTNRDWNQHVILLMQRAGLIRVESPPQLRDDDAFHELPISVVNETAIWDSPHQLTDAFKAVRSLERSRVDDAHNAMLSLLDMQQQCSACLSSAFENIYYPTALACGGCANCRTTNRKSYVESVGLRAENYHERQLIGSPMNPYWRERTVGSQILHIWLSRSDTADHIINIILKLLGWGHQQFILSETFIERHLRDNEQFIASCALYARTPHHFVPFSRLEKHQIFAVPTMILFTEDAPLADKIYQHWQRFNRTIDKSIPVTYLYDQQLYLKSESGLFRNRVNGHKEYAQGFLRWVKSTEKLL